MALLDDGTIHSWGCNETGQLALNSLSACSLVPTLVPVEQKMKTIFTGGDRSLGVSFAISQDGQLFSCGYNENGNLGVGDTEQRIQFTPVDLPNVQTIACSSSHTLALSKSTINNTNNHS
jgi:alpha-tubulin suppressor-like RCC1 family protein